MENEIRKTVGNLNRNLTIAYIGPKVVSLTHENIDKVIEAMEELKLLEVRIIFAHTNDAVAFSCWLHRYGMYGKYYVVFASTWAIYDPETAWIPEYLTWCTKEMLQEVIVSWIFFGFGRPVDIYGESYTDSLGFPMLSIVWKRK